MNTYKLSEIPTHIRKYFRPIDERTSRVINYRPTCSCGNNDIVPNDLETIATPTGSGTIDPTLVTGRRGMNRPRSDGDGVRLITRYEQRKYAEQLRNSIHKKDMRKDAGSSFDHYVRTDKSGARPAPYELLEKWIENGWIERVIVPEIKYHEPVPGIILDPFIGSGTTGAVARELGRRWVGLDISMEYLDQQAKIRALKWTPKDALDDLPLFENICKSEDIDK